MTRLPYRSAASLLLRPRPVAWIPRAWESTTSADQDKDGHIEKAPNESILWFDNLFPLKPSGLLRIPWFNPESDLTELLRRFENSSLGIMDPINLVKRAIPSEAPMKVTEIIPRLKDGGVFVKFQHPANVPAHDIEGLVTKLLAEKRIKPFFSPLRSVQAGLVRGVPWLEDLHRFPKARLRVEFVPPNPGGEAVELSQEDLYSMFRKYGKIAEITSQPWDSKVLPKFAYVDFALVRDAIMARNCLHGYVVSEAKGGGKSGTKLRMSYEERTKQHRFWDWMTNHPRIVIPVLVALLTGLTVVIFDPIRSFFVKSHVTHRFRLSNSKLYRWFRKQTTDLFHRDKSEKAGLEAIWTHRQDLIEQIRKWLMETAETFIVVQGPRGSGKKELVLEQALKDKTNILLIDCKPIVEARGESATIKQLGSAVGYRPIFSWANSMSSMIDLAVQSTTGVKAGFSETLESQLQKILHTTAGALTEICLSSRHKTDSDAALPDDAYLEAHPEKRPVVVIENFLHKGDANAIVYDKISEWAAALVQSNVAHVIFLANDSSYTKTLTKALPDRVFRHAALGDLSPEVAKRFILSHVEQTKEERKAEQEAEEEGDEEKLKVAYVRPNLRNLDESLDVLGGRLTDLEFLARRLKAGQSPKQAVAEITDQAASEILKMFLLPGRINSDSDHSWSVEQVWYLVKALAKKESLRYNEILLSDTFKSSLSAPNGESALEGLSSLELITIKTRLGRPESIVVGKPVYQAAFERLVNDPVLSAKLDFTVLTELVKVEAKNIEKYEAELISLATLPKQPAQITPRVTYLLSKLDASQKKIEGYEKEQGALKMVLSKEN
ncbi:RNA12 protein [Microdochium trichocladiopsis]|uniref:Mitochondrial escape protein 2 n=1 Tax=Microdochium trichocladiopsis TaxID=1682393 RepID=A0A9P9BTW3_9PEZI|nr:RNA12 protein [Microdochium trichocladiopsis]KAH7040406.1 RNA12 protein [Microdochium trichocladiopsis]